MDWENLLEIVCIYLDRSRNSSEISLLRSKSTLCKEVWFSLWRTCSSQRKLDKISLNKIISQSRDSSIKDLKFRAFIFLSLYKCFLLSSCFGWFNALFN